MRNSFWPFSQCLDTRIWWLMLHFRNKYGTSKIIGVIRNLWWLWIFDQGPARKGVRGCRSPRCYPRRCPVVLPQIFILTITCVGISVISHSLFQNVKGSRCYFWNLSEYFRHFNEFYQLFDYVLERGSGCFTPLGVLPLENLYNPSCTCVYLSVITTNCFLTLGV